MHYTFVMKRETRDPNLLCQVHFLILKSWDVLALESVEIESRFFVFVFLSQFQVVISRTAGCFVVVFWELVLCQGCAVMPMVACEGLRNVGAGGASRNCLFWIVQG